MKVDVDTGASTSFSEGNYIFGEPLFAARPGGQSENEGEDDGVLLTVGSSQDAESSMLAVIDAKTITLVASAKIPSFIPLGFHGSFVRSTEN